MSRPDVVCLCGSTRFPGAFEAANRALTLEGKIVLSVGMFGHLEGMDMDGPLKKQLDELHLRKIDLADSILVLNVDGYVGSSTKREIAYALSRRKAVRFRDQEAGDKWLEANVAEVDRLMASFGV
jgi:hypothetical protein